jgi:hypothetical protein
MQHDPPKTTTAAADEVGTSAANLIASLRNRRFKQPGKDALGHYQWYRADIERAREALSRDRRHKKNQREPAAV